MEINLNGQSSNDGDTPGLIARPPLIYLGALLLGFAWDQLLPLPFLIPGTDLTHRIIGGALIFIGLMLAVSGARNFSKAGTPVQSVRPTRTLVTTGIHAWTRNPIYLGMFLIYGGVGVATQSPWTLLITVPLAITIQFGVVAREELYLEQRFNDTYRTYKARVRRWL